jgi:hypothetical protein
MQGEEGAVSLTTKARSADSGGGPGERKLQNVNHVSGFRPLNDVPGELLHREPYTVDLDAQSFGFESTLTPRTDRSVSEGLLQLHASKPPVLV